MMEIKKDQQGSEAWLSFLQEAHRQDPGKTPAIFSGYVTGLGRDTYSLISEELTRTTKKPIQVLDHGCGDGFL